MRFLKVAAILLALGAIAGAVIGVVMLLGVTLTTAGSARGLTFQIFAAATGFGAAVGAVLGPLIAVVFLRRVPLWKATAVTAGAAGLGATLGSFTRVPFAWAYGAVAMAVLMALWLRHRYNTPAKEPSSQP